MNTHLHQYKRHILFRLYYPEANLNKKKQTDRNVILSYSVQSGKGPLVEPHPCWITSFTEFVIRIQSSRSNVTPSPAERIYFVFTQCAKILRINWVRHTHLWLHACRECDRLPCWPSGGQQLLHQRWISGIHCTQATKHASEGSILALKPREDVIRSRKTGVSVVPQIGLMSSSKDQKVERINWSWYMQVTSKEARIGTICYFLIKTKRFVRSHHWHSN